MPRDADKLVHAVLFAAGTASLVAVGVPWYVAAAGQCAHGWISEKLQAHIPGRGADSVGGRCGGRRGGDSTGRDRYPLTTRSHNGQLSSY